MAHPNSILKVKMTPEKFFNLYDFSHDIQEYIEYIDDINDDYEPVIYYAGSRKYEVNWLDDDNKKENFRRKNVRGDIKDRVESGSNYTSEWVNWLNTNKESPWSQEPRKEKTTKLSFKERGGLTVQTIEDRENFSLCPDFTDRGDRPSVVFCKVLEAFAEKTHNLQEKESFFKKNSIGEKWGSLKTLKTLEPWVKVARNTLDTRCKLSLNDKSVKKYPIYTFEIFERVFKDELKSAEEKEDDSSFKLSARAQEFVPSSKVAWGEKERERPPLPRSGPPKRWGCTPIERKIPQKKPPSSHRPRTTSKNSTQHVSWQQKDLAFQELNTKMDMIIKGLETPVVQAQKVIQAPDYGVW